MNSKNATHQPTLGKQDRQNPPGSVGQTGAEWQTTVDGIDHPICVTDLGGTVIRSNRVFKDLTGEDGRQNIGRPLRDLIPDAAGEDGILPADSPAADAARPRRTILFGNLRLAVARVPLFDATGDHYGDVCLFTDTGNRGRRLLRVARMEAIGRVTARIAHDLNNMMAVVIGFSDMLIQQLAGNDQLLTCATKTRAAGETVLRITDDLFTFAVNRSDEVAVIDLGEFLVGMNEKLHAMVEGEHTLTVTTGPQPTRVRVNAEFLRRVIHALLASAEDRMQDGGQIAINTRMTVIDESYIPEQFDLPRGPCVVLSISDNGKGLNADQQERMFEPFFATMSGRRTSGVGLAIVYAAVRQWNGDIRVTTNIGSGTAIEIYLPAVDADGINRGNRD